MIKPTLQEVEAEETLILAIWNEQAEIGGFRKHKRLLPDAKQAIRQQIKEGYDHESIRESIKNFAWAMSSEKSFLSTNDQMHNWTLADYLSRGKRDDKGKRWLWFHPDYFNEEKWYTSKVKQHITMERERRLEKEKRQNSRPINNKTVSDLAAGITKEPPSPAKRQLWKEIQALKG